MRIELPKLSLVLLIGASGSGKSTFSRKHFLPTEVLSSDGCRGFVSDDENCLEATTDAFDVLHYILRKRLSRGLLTVIDATNVQPESRRPLIKIAQEFHTVAVAVAFNVDPDICYERNRNRPDRQFGDHVVRNQTRDMRRSLRGLAKEGIRYVHVLRSPAEIDAVEFERTPLWTDKRDETGPFDIIGDIHGCYDELVELLAKLEPKRKVVFLGDLVDRGPNSPAVLRLVMEMVESGQALCVPGNHDMKLLRKLKGREVQISHGLAETLEQLAIEPPEFIQQVTRFLDGLISHYVLDGGKLVVAHAGMKAEMQGRASGRVRDFALYGETTGETDDFGLPVRYNWAAEYRGSARVVYGHTPVPEAEWLNRTINIDTGCVFGGKLTALRYPEMELIEVAAKATYAVSAKPFLEAPAANLSTQHEQDEVLDYEDISGKRIVHTRLRGNVTLREENATAALEAMSRFATNPKWLVYLPPTMSPCETTSLPGLLEHPSEAFEYFRLNGIGKVICEEKHMGSRAVAIVCRNEETARTRFGVATGEIGAVVTRTGRRFFDDFTLERALLDRLVAAMDRSGLWEKLGSDWVVLDCELMPWSAKAQELLRRQYAPVGSAGVGATRQAMSAMKTAAERLPEDEVLSGLVEHVSLRAAMIEAYVDAYRRYCWDIGSLDDLRLAPFHILATEGHVHVDQDHVWHMDTIASLCEEEPILFRTPYRLVDTLDQESMAAGVAWWEELTGKGGEGMVVKPLDFVARGPKGLVQPAVKCRGREYLRIIYGPEYTLPENLERLRKRGLGVKRSLALREFALGVEALERFVRREPLRRVHECVFAVLAMETEPVDPRL
ncbi:MAG TPA: polynucleotide kinase-phosphatase [Fimbriimonadaceae bacterium]|nr:polynucleotide kinase-phosphatase [Fimbriimonadaceae bacterium]